MSVDLYDLAESLRCLLIATALAWIAYAWLNRVEYRRAVLVLVFIAAVDFLAHALAAFAARPDSGIPNEFSIYSLFILLATAAGLAAALAYARRVEMDPSLILDAALVTVLAGGIGARAYHVLTHWEYYSERTAEVTNFTQGGMGLRGGLLLGLAALLLFVKIRRVSFWKLADAGALGLALAESIGWFGAHLIGANYGVVSYLAFAQDLPDVYGIIAPRIPVQLIAVGFFFALFLLLVWSSRRWQARPGMVFFTFLTVSALGSAALDFMRADETLVWNGWRIDLIVDIVLAVFGVIGVWVWRRNPHWKLPVAASASPHSTELGKGTR